MRMNISVSDKLRKRMDTIKEKPNWSAIASKAFEDYLVDYDLEKKKEVGLKMEDAIERLQRSKEKLESEVYPLGVEEGKRWAREDAEYEELERLSRARTETSWGSEWEFVEVEDPSFKLWNIIRGYPEAYNQGCGPEEFWESDGELCKYKAYLTGFADGAMEIFEMVKS